MKILAVLLIFILAGCASESFPQSDGPELFENIGFAAAAPDHVFVARGSVQQLEVRHGMVRVESVPLTFETSGRIAAVYVDPGDAVYEGQLLARLCTEALEEQLENAELRLTDLIRNSEIEAEIFALQMTLRHLDYNEAIRRATAVFDAGAILAAENILHEIERAELFHTHAMQTRELDIADTRRQIAEVHERIDDTRLFSPMDGVITALRFHGTPAVYINYTDEIFVEDLNPNLSILLQNSARVRAHINGIVYELEPIEMSLEEIAQVQITGSHMRWQYGIIPPPCGTMPPKGAYASLVYYTLLREDTLRVPSNAVTVTRDSTTVYRITPDGERERIFVRIGIITDTYIEILEGLEEGDIVYVR
ncbi:MAG: biotin/lipoyl-binding protein [Defluviitaleaceae bacterium]|nr:biotin/lipoyl-binding protein [Defluviitaleaceae bacterium]